MARNGGRIGAGVVGAVVSVLGLAWAFQASLPGESGPGRAIDGLVRLTAPFSYDRPWATLRYPWVALGPAAAAGLLLVLARFRKLPYVTAALALAAGGQAFLLADRLGPGLALFGAAAALAFAGSRRPGAPPDEGGGGARGGAALWPLALIPLAVLLVYRLADDPPNTFLWARPTLYHLLRFLEGKDGLLEEALVWQQGRETTSQESLPWVLMALGSFRLFGVGLLALRWISVWSALAGLAVWGVLLQRHFGRWIALAGVALLGLTPVFLVYSRAEVYVGFTPFFAALVALLLAELLGRRRRRRLLVPLGLVLGTIPYFYSPLRLFVVTVPAVVAGDGLSRAWRARRGRLLARTGLDLALLLLPLALLAVPQWPERSFVVREFLNGRGEQVINMTRDRGYMSLYLADATIGPPYPLAVRLQVAGRIIGTNIVETVKFLAGTRPGRVDDGSAAASLAGGALSLIGLGAAAAWAGRARYRNMLIWLAFALAPVLLANLVTGGRLLHATVPLALAAAVGLAALAREWRRLLPRLLAPLAPAGALAVAGAVALMSLGSAFAPLERPRELDYQTSTARLVGRLIEDGPVVLACPSWNFYESGVIRFLNAERERELGGPRIACCFADQPCPWLLPLLAEGRLPDAVALLVETGLPESGAVEELHQLLDERFPDLPRSSPAPRYIVYHLGHDDLARRAPLPPESMESLSLGD